MNTSMSWIKAYVPDLDVSAQEYTDAMTLSGTKVEGFTRMDQNLEKIVVGRIDRIEKHPDADKLIVCQVAVDEKGNQTQIVTGASNVKEGDKVPVVLDGGRVAASAHDGKEYPEGIKIKKGKLRGVESCGMLCSIGELGSTKDSYPDACEDGIYILSDNPDYKDAPVGSDAVELLGLRDVTFEYEITSNRVDCFSEIGIAREAAATFRKKLMLPEVKPTGNTERTEDYISVEVKDSKLCPRYTARVVKNIRIAPSPEWMKRRLASVGIRPINNLVDITNYVMEEYGQPMHAYDLDTIEGRKIIVSRAEDGEEFQTLDGQVRKLDSSILMIRDAQKAVGIAGIMGGENSKITDSVTTVLLEAACFDGTNTRLSGKKLGMRTDAQAKFEKGLDPNLAMEAMNRACQLLEEIGAGEVVGGSVDFYPNPKEPEILSYDPQRINALLGTDIAPEAMAEYFRSIGLLADEEKCQLTVPSWRQDLHCLADLAEEVARFYGYDNIPMTLPKGETTRGKIQKKEQVENIARIAAERYGFSEGMCYSFESPKVFDRLRLPADDPRRRAITIANPLGEDYSVMRTTPIHGMLASLASNYNRRNKEVRLYEIGNVYLPKELPLESLPDERTQLTLGMYGSGDFFELKGLLEQLFNRCGLLKRTEYANEGSRSYLHPGRQAEIRCDGTVLGYLGEVHPEVCDTYGIGTKTYLAVIDLPEIVARTNFGRKFKPIAKFPSISRDISMVMPKEITAGEIEEVIQKRGGKLLESYHLFDVYEGAQIQDGFKSMAYSISFRAPDRTLEDQDVAKVMDKILKGLQERNVELRA